MSTVAINAVVCTVCGAVAGSWQQSARCPCYVLFTAHSTRIPFPSLSHFLSSFFIIDSRIILPSEKTSADHAPLITSNTIASSTAINTPRALSPTTSCAQPTITKVLARTRAPAPQLPILTRRREEPPTVIMHAYAPAGLALTKARMEWPRKQRHQRSFDSNKSDASRNSRASAALGRLKGIWGSSRTRLGQLMRRDSQPVL